jgi:hypothetical protein
MEHEPEKMELGASDTRRPLPGREGRGAHLRRLEKGAKVVAGNQSGTFLEPTVQTAATTSMVITKEETFGPVAPLYRLKTDAEAIKMANDPPTQPFAARGGGQGRGSRPISTAATSAESGASPRPSNTASSGSTRASSRRNPAGEIAPFGGMKESCIDLI